MSDQITRETTEIVGDYAVVVEIKIKPTARLTKTDIRMMFIREAEMAIIELQKRAPQVLVASANATYRTENIA